MAHTLLKTTLTVLCWTVLSTLASAQEVDLAGEWKTTWGDATLSRTSNGFEGAYTEDNGRIRLLYTVDGTYEGEWSENSSAQECDTPSEITGSKHWGRIKGPISQNGGTLIFKWSYCDTEEYNREWQFTREVLQPVTEDTPASFEGNWIVNWQDSPQNEAFISIYKEYRWDCVNYEDGWCRKRIEGNAPILLSGGQLVPGESGQPSGNVNIEGGTMNVLWNYGHFGIWRGSSVIKAASNDYLVGDWEGGGNTGKENWRRVRSLVKYTGGIRTDAAGFEREVRKPLGQPVTLTTKYLPPVHDARGNRESVSLNLYGDNMWGVHDYYLPKETDIEITGRWFICADGEFLSGLNIAANCMDHGGVAGIQLHLMAWPNAVPGLKLLTFDNQTVPFLLDITDFPTPVVVENERVEVSRVVLLDDQAGQRQAPGARVKNYSYPYDRNGIRTAGLNTRMLAVIGKNLDLAGESFLVSPDDKITYRRLTLPSNIQGAVTRAAANLSGISIGADEDVITVRADLHAGIRGGVKEIMINGEPKGWNLLFNNQLGSIQFLRAGATPNDLPERTFYIGETIHVGVKANNDNYPIDNLDIILEAEKYPATTADPRNEARRLARITLRRTDDIGRGQNFAKSPPLLLTQAGASSSVTAAAGEIVVTLQPGERIVAKPADRFSLITLPPVVSADVLDKPRRSGLWQYALDRVSQCPGVGGDPKADDFPMEASKVYENWILTEAIANRWRDKSLTTNRSATRKINVSKGDHAALILIRDALLPIVKSENEKLRQYLGRGDAGKTKAMRYYNLARKTPGSAQNAFWSLRQENNVWVEIVEPVYASAPPTRMNRGIKLARMLDFDAFRILIQDPSQSRPPNKPDTQDRINEIVAKHLKQQYAETNAAFRRARNAGNCNIDELLVIAGNGADPAVAKLLPDLVKQENGRWRPDVEARSYVKSVPILGGAVRAQDAYAEIDDAYKSMAIALAAAPVALAGTAIAAGGGTTAVTAGTALSALALGADLFDMAYYGRKGVEQYLNGEEDYYTQLGLSPVLGPEIVKEAAARRDSLLAATIGVIAPGVSGAAGFKALDDITKINKGRALVRGEGGLPNLDDLSDAQKTDVAAYYKSLKETDASTTARLTEAEQADLDLFKSRYETQASAGDDFDVLDIGDFGNAPAKTELEKTQVDTARADKVGGGTPRPDRTEVDMTAPKNRYRSRLDREPPVQWDETVSRDVDNLPTGEASKHISNEDADKLMRLRRPLTPDEQAMRDDMLRQYFNKPEELSQTRREILDAALNDRPAKRFAPADESPLPLPSKQRVDDFLEADKGSFSKHLTPQQKQALFEDGADLDADQLIQKMDLMRTGQAPTNYAIDDEMAAALEKVFETKATQAPDATLPSSTLPVGPSGTQILDPIKVPKDTPLGPNDTVITPSIDIPAAKSTDPNQTAKFDQSDLDELVRIPSSDLLTQVGPFRGIYVEEAIPGAKVKIEMKRMPPGTKQNIANPQTPMVLDPQRSHTYLYTVMPDGEVRYIPQELTFKNTADGEIVEVEKFKHSMLTEGGLAGQSGEIKYVNGSWVINGDSGRYGLYHNPATDRPVSRSRESLQAAKKIIEDYRVNTPDGKPVTFKVQHNKH